MNRFIEIDDLLVPDGYEPIAFRVPLDGELFVGNAKHVLRHTHGDDMTTEKLIVRETSTDVNAFDVGTTILVSNGTDGPYVNRVLVAVIGDRDYPFVCESISSRLSHECWRFAKKPLNKLAEVE